MAEWEGVAPPARPVPSELAGRPVLWLAVTSHSHQAGGTPTGLSGEESVHGTTPSVNSNLPTNSLFNKELYVLLNFIHRVYPIYYFKYI